MSAARIRRMIRGTGRLLDFSGGYIRSDYILIKSNLKREIKTDIESMASDWDAVGSDIWTTIKHQAQELLSKND